MFVFSGAKEYENDEVGGPSRFQRSNAEFPSLQQR